MDVDHANFYEKLPQILAHIRAARFVAFDLELSGIPTRKFNVGYPSISDRYVENKAAAEKFHILQVGLTCVEEDVSTGTYLLRPYNFNLSPLIADDFGIDRSFTYSASAVNFLLNHNYDMASPFEKGITFLTRAETDRAKLNLMKRYDKESIPDIFIRPADKETPLFMARVRRDIETWQKTRKENETSFEVRNPNPDHPAFPHPLDRLQRRIVHQIVRADFPLLTTATKKDGVTVQLKDPKEEEELKSNLNKRIAHSLQQQIGFRWVAEALAGTYESASQNFHKTPGSDRLSPQQSCGPKVLLGHNCFMDLVFIYHLFFGDLPDTVEEFQQLLHSTFPMIIDSKYLATEGEGKSGNKRFALGELENILSTEDEQPSMQIPYDHAKEVRLDDEKYHEAGFDSFVTAKIFLRMASKAGKSVRKALSAPSSEPNEVIHETAFVDVKSKNKKRSKSKPTTDTKAATQKSFSSTNPFESLTDSDMQDAAARVDSPTQDIKAQVIESGARVSDADAQELARVTNQLGRLTMNGSAKLLPAWDDAFWYPYLNKLRVYGTVEEECDLNNHNRSSAPTTPPCQDSPAARAPKDTTREQTDHRRQSVFERVKKALNPFE